MSRQTSLRVLHAVLRCARHRRVVDRAALELRVDCTEPELEEALTNLECEGLVAKCSMAQTTCWRLTLTGLAAAVATLPRAHKRTLMRAQSAA
jgi:RIO-like serine/threonine protein kinase